jgi:hypothetical protein
VTVTFGQYNRLERHLRKLLRAALLVLPFLLLTHDFTMSMHDISNDAGETSHHFEQSGTGSSIHHVNVDAEPFYPASPCHPAKCPEINECGTERAVVPFSGKEHIASGTSVCADTSMQEHATLSSVGSTRVHRAHSGRAILAALNTLII